MGLIFAGCCAPTTYVVGYDVPSLRDFEREHNEAEATLNSSSLEKNLPDSGIDEFWDVKEKPCESGHSSTATPGCAVFATDPYPQTRLNINWNND